MTTLHELKAAKEAATSDLIKAVGMFFAFSNEQFTENKTPLKEGEKYRALGMGAYMPAGNVEAWKEGQAKIEAEYRAAINGGGLRRAEIAYQLGNHECYYTGDISDAVSHLGEGYTEAEVWQVYQEERLTRAED